LRQDDVERTRLLNAAQGAFIAAIETQEGMAYPDSDMRHFESSRYLGIQVDDPQLAQGLCSTIDAMNGLTN
jgi:hypothetical protein